MKAHTLKQIGLVQANCDSQLSPKITNETILVVFLIYLIIREIRK